MLQWLYWQPNLINFWHINENTKMSVSSLTLNFNTFHPDIFFTYHLSLSASCELSFSLFSFRDRRSLYVILWRRPIITSGNNNGRITRAIKWQCVLEKEKKTAGKIAITICFRIDSYLLQYCISIKFVRVVSCLLT